MMVKVSEDIYCLSDLELPHLVAGVELGVDHGVTANLAGGRPHVVIIGDRHLREYKIFTKIQDFLCIKNSPSLFSLTLNTSPEGWQTQSLYCPSSPE